MARVFAGVVFDFGNVLYSVDYPAMARRLAADRAEEFYRGFVGSDLQVAYETGRVGLEEVLDGLAVQGFPTDEARFLDAYLSVFSPVGGMGDLVGGLARQLPLGLLSNTSREHARHFIERVPEFRFFRASVYSFELGCMKPAPGLYKEIAARLGAPANELVYVDDIEEYARGAEAVGMTGIWFKGAEDLRQRLIALGLESRKPSRA